MPQSPLGMVFMALDPSFRTEKREHDDSPGDGRYLFYRPINWRFPEMGLPP